MILKKLNWRAEGTVGTPKNGLRFKHRSSTWLTPNIWLSRWKTVAAHCAVMSSFWTGLHERTMHWADLIASEAFFLYNIFLPVLWTFLKVPEPGFFLLVSTSGVFGFSIFFLFFFIFFVFPFLFCVSFFFAISKNS